MINDKWKCSLCGHIYTGPDLPEDYVCPVCKATRDKFIKINK